MLELAHAFIKWRLSKRSTLLGWIVVFVLQALLAAAVFSLFLYGFQIPFNVISAYAAFAFVVAAGLSGLAFAVLWACAAMLIANYTAGALLGAYVGSSDWWASAAAQWAAGQSVPPVLVAILAAIPLLYVVSSIGLHRVWTYMLDNLLSRLTALKGSARTKGRADDAEGRVTPAEAAVYIDQGEAGSEGLTVTDNSVIAKPEPGIEEDGGDGGDEVTDKPLDGSDLYNKMGVDVGGGALAGLEGPAGSNSGSEGEKPAKASTNVRSLVPTKFGGTKNELPKEVRNRLRMISETYMTDVDNAADEEAASMAFISRFKNHLVGMTDEHFSHLLSLTAGNGAGVVKLAREVMKNGSHIETSLEAAVDATSGINDLDANNLRRGDSVDAANGGAGKPDDGEAGSSEGMGKKLDADALLANGHRFSSLLIKAAAEGAPRDASDVDDAVPPETGPLSGKIDEDQGALGSSEGGQDLPPEQIGAARADQLPATKVGPPSASTPSPAAVPVNDFADFAEGLLRKVNGSNDGSDENPGPGEDGAASRPADETAGVKPDPTSDPNNGNGSGEGGMLGFGDNTGTTAAQQDLPQPGKGNDSVSETSNPETANKITPELCYSFSGILESKGSAGDIRARLDAFEKNNGHSANVMLKSALLVETFGPEKVSVLGSRVSTIFRDTIDMSLESQLKEYALLEHRVSAMENTPHNLTGSQLNSASSQANALVAALAKLDDSDVAVLTAQANANQIVKRIADLHAMLVSPTNRPKTAFDPASRSAATNFLDARKEENARAAGVELTDGNPAAAVPAAAPSAPEVKAPEIASRNVPSKTPAPVQASPATTEHALSDLHHECTPFADLAEVVGAAARGEEWQFHDNLGSVFEDPFDVPLDDGVDRVAARKHMLALQMLRERARPLVEAAQRSAAEAEARMVEAAELEQQKEVIARERADLNAVRHRLDERSAALAKLERELEEKEKLAESYTDELIGNIDTVREELAFFKKPGVPPRFSDFRKDYSRLLLLQDMTQRMKSLAIPLGDVLPAGLPERMSPEFISSMMSSACALQRSRDFFIKICDFLEIDRSTKEKLAVVDMLEHANDQVEREFLQKVHNFATSGQDGMEQLRTWMDDCVSESILITKGQSVAAEDLDGLKAKLDNVETERDMLTSELATVRAELEQLQSVERAEDGKNENASSATGPRKFDDRSVVENIEQLFEQNDFRRVRGVLPIQVYGNSVFVGLTQDDWKGHPDREATFEAIKEAKNHVVLFTDCEELPEVVLNSHIAVKPLRLIHASDFIEEVIKEESIDA